MKNTSLFFALFFLLGLVTLNNTLPLLAAPYIVGDIAGSNDIAFYTVTFYSIGNILGVPIGRSCVSRINPSMFLLLFVSLFAFFTWTGGFSENYPIFLIFRVFAGIFSGTLFPQIAHLFATMAPNDKQDYFRFILITIFTLIPAIGAALGGWIAYEYHWQWLFYANATMILIVGLFLWQKLKFTPFTEEKVPFDLIGYIFYSLAFVSLSLVITMGQQLDWHRSPLISTLAVLGAFSMGFFILWELNHPHPIMDLKLLKKFTFAFALFNLALIFSTYFGMVILLSYWLKIWVNYTPYWIGLIIGTMAIAGFFPLWMRKGLHRQDCRISLGIALVLLSISCIHTMFFNIEINFGRIAFSRALAGFGLAFFLPPLFRLCFNSYPPTTAPSVIVFFQTARVLGGGLGAAVFSTIWQRRQAFFHDRLGDQLTVFSNQTKEYFTKAKEIDLQGQPALAELGNLLDRQSTALALDDSFYLMGLILAGLLVFLLLTVLFRCKGFNPEKKEETLAVKDT